LFTRELEKKIKEVDSRVRKLEEGHTLVGRRIEKENGKGRSIPTWTEVIGRKKRRRKDPSQTELGTEQEGTVTEERRREERRKEEDGNKKKDKGPIQAQEETPQRSWSTLGNSGGFLS